MKMPSLEFLLAGSFFLAVIAATAVRLWLAARQIATVRAHRHAVPPAFADRISLAEHQKAADYTVATIQLGRRSAVLDALVTLALTIGGLIGALDLLWQRSGWS